MHVLYLHGFASSPASSKAEFLATHFARYGLTLHCPDLNVPDFSTLTTTRMITEVRNVLEGLAPAPVVLIGSSLGAFVALHLAEHSRPRDGLTDTGTHPIERLVLLAPAFDFGSDRMSKLGNEEMIRWRETGWLEMTHHAYGEVRRVHYELFLDAGNYDSFAVKCEIPILVLQGYGDEVVDPSLAERFASNRPHVSLVMLNDGHQLKVSLDRLWDEIVVFLELEPLTS